MKNKEEKIVDEIMEKSKEISDEEKSIYNMTEYLQGYLDEFLKDFQKKYEGEITREIVDTVVEMFLEKYVKEHPSLKAKYTFGANVVRKEEGISYEVVIKLKKEKNGE